MGRQAYLTRVCLVSTTLLWVPIVLFICDSSSLRFYVKSRLKILVNFLPYCSIRIDAERLEDLVSVLLPTSRTHI